MQAARGNITTEKKDNNVASKILLKLKHGEPVDTIMKKNGWKTGTPLGKRGERITAPIEATPQKDLRKIQGGITKTITDYNNGTQKIKFIPHKADMMYVDAIEEAIKEEKKKAWKYITMTIQTEESDIEIGMIRAENDIEEEEIDEVHMAELSPRGFPITTANGETRKIDRTKIRKWQHGKEE